MNIIIEILLIFFSYYIFIKFIFFIIKLLKKSKLNYQKNKFEPMINQNFTNNYIYENKK